MIEGFDQILHAGLHVEVPRQKCSQICDQVSEMLPCHHDRGNEHLKIAFVSVSSQLDECLCILIQNKTVLRAIDAKLVEVGAHLRGESEIGGRAFLFSNNDSEFIDDFAFAHALKKRTYKAICDYFRRVAAQKLRDSGNAVADNILQQFPRQPPNPMIWVAQ